MERRRFFLESESKNQSIVRLEIDRAHKLFKSDAVHLIRAMNFQVMCKCAQVIYNLYGNDEQVMKKLLIVINKR